MAIEPEPLAKRARGDYNRGQGIATGAMERALISLQER